MNACPRAIVLPIKEYLLRRMKPGKDEAVIMLSSYPLPSLDPKTNILFLSVDDVTNPLRPTAFRKSHAIEVIKFLGEQRNLSHLYICCDGGVSRSAALAASLQYVWDGNDDAIWRDPHYHPNELIYSIMRSALKTPCSQEELSSKIAVSERALAYKIRESYQ